MDAATTEPARTDFDVVIVGAGFAGLYALYELRRRGRSVIVIEAGDGVGGTWYWNRYPGARVDVYSLSYSYSFSPDLEQEWSWSEHFAAQPELEAYANHVADRFDLGRDIRLGRRVRSAVWDPESSRWTLEDERGGRVTGRFVVWATGGYSKPAVPQIEGLDDLAGELYHAPVWPREPIDFAGKRIGIIGTGATGMQIIQALVDEPIKHLTVFQRTAEYAVPAGRIENDPEWVDAFKATYREYREAARESPGGVLYDHFVQTDVSEMSDPEFEAFMRSAFDHPLGFYPYSGIKNLLTDERTNARVADFVRREIRRRVADPATAEKLIPSGHFMGSRRILGERGYFEIYNRDDVTLVDVKTEPIRKVADAGVQTSERTYELDMLVLATGFDSGTGALAHVEVVGRHGRLADYWSEGPVTYLGLAMSGFPNTFMIWGPGSPSIRSQGFVAIEQQVEWLADLFDHVWVEGVRTVEPTPEADEAWTRHADSLVQRTLLARDDSQYFGSNVRGKPRRYVAYTGGTYVYGELCNDVRDHGYEGFEFTLDDGSSTCSSKTWSGPRSDGSLTFRLGNSAI